MQLHRGPVVLPLAKDAHDIEHHLPRQVGPPGAMGRSDSSRAPAPGPGDRTRDTSRAPRAPRGWRGECRPTGLVAVGRRDLIGRDTQPGIRHSQPMPQEFTDLDLVTDQADGQQVLAIRR